MEPVGQKFLLVYSGVLTLLLAASLATGFLRFRKADPVELTVQRINVVEPDGTLRMVLSNHAKLPGVIVRGKEQPPSERPQAGVLFFNDEGSENGGLIFGGHRNAKGEVVDSGGSLTFDKYDANQIVQLMGVDDRDDRLAGLIVSDSAAGIGNQRRVWIGRREDGAASLALSDAAGRKRILMEVKANGDSSLSFLDGEGKVVKQWVPHP
jgi:hypothetical protein